MWELYIATELGDLIKEEIVTLQQIEVTGRVRSDLRIGLWIIIGSDMPCLFCLKTDLNLIYPTESSLSQTTSTSIIMPNDGPSYESHKVADSIETAPAKARNTAVGGAIGKGSPNAVASLGMPTFESKEAKQKYFKEHLAGAFRYLGGEGYGKEGAAGHVSVRDPIKEDHFWLNPLAKHFSTITVSDLVLVDHKGNAVEGGNMAPINAAAFAIHSAIHEARPDVIAACHAHSIHGKAYASLGIELDITTQDSCLFYKDHALYNSFGGVVFQAEEGRNIARALGDKKAMILQNHGLLTVGTTVDEAVFLFGAMDRCCHAQLLADAAAFGRGIKTIKIDEEDAQYTHDSIAGHDVSFIQFQSEYNRILAETNGAFLA